MIRTTHQHVRPMAQSHNELRHEDSDGTRQVGPYTLRRLLGSGGMGEVYLGEHTLLERPCAIKLIRRDRSADPQAIARFENEARATAKLTHPNTVEIFDFGTTEDGTHFYAMEFLPGLSLQDIVDRTGPLPAARVIHVLRQVCAALAEVHQHGMIHRDVKPANIFAAERGGNYDVAKLLDFGLVKISGEEAGIDDMEVTRDGLALGSPLYAAPELTLGEHEVDRRTDLYSLGATAYFLLTGHAVFAGENPLRLAFAHSFETPVPPSQLREGIPADLEAIVLRCLAKSPEDRFASAEELEQALAACTVDEPWTPEQAEAWWQRSSDFTSGAATVAIDEFAETSICRRVSAGFAQ